MPEKMNRQILLAARPVGAPKDSDFKLNDAPIPEPGEGEILTRTIYLSLDPYMRGRMSEAKSYAQNVELGQVMVGGTVSQVVKSNNPRFRQGDYVVGYDGWQEYAVSDGAMMAPVDPARMPISTALGCLGMPGMTAYVGLMDIGQPKEGETVVVASASGAVGSMVGQLAKAKGCRAVGIAGGPEKCAFVVDELGFDACVDYKDPDFRKHLKAACPDGIDIYFENVGGPVLEAVMGLFNTYARMPLCGIISQYNATELPQGPDQLGRFLATMLVNRMTVQAFIVTEYWNRYPDFIREVGGLFAEGKIKYREDIVDGLENAPAAFRGLLEGKNFGKLLVRVSDDPTRG